MKDSVLFVNRDQMEIKEFLSAMQDYTFEVDTADSGLEAAILLRKKNYKVVITGINLSTYDGTKLIAYLNAHCPYTACIVYTTRVDLAQLRLLVNKRDVFRIFLKPVNYRGDFYNAIRDGFTYYDMQEAEEEEQKIREKKQRSMEAAGLETGESALQEGKEWKQIRRVIDPLAVWSMKAADLPLSGEEEKALAEYELAILDYYFRENYGTCESLEMIRTGICQEFFTDEEKQSIELKINQKPVNPKTGFYQQLHFMIWLVIRMITEISDYYRVKIELDFQIPFRPVILIRASIGKEKQEEYGKEKLKQVYLTVISHIIEKMAGQCKVRLTEDTISCQIQMRIESPKKRNRRE